MRTFFRAIAKISEGMHWISGGTICVMMLVTLADVVMRPFGHPIVGSFEIVSFLGAIVVGFAIPYTSGMNGHIFVDFLINRLGPERKNVMYATTRLMGMFLFFLLGLFFLSMARDLYVKGEVSPTFRLPFYPIAAGLGVSSFVQVLVMASTIVKAYRGTHE